jgi:hypothetical protein
VSAWLLKLPPWRAEAICVALQAILLKATRRVLKPAALNP